jgi:hypothetical protein
MAILHQCSNGDEDAATVCLERYRRCARAIRDAGVGTRAVAKPAN